MTTTPHLDLIDERMAKMRRVVDERGGTPEDQALAHVAEYQRRKRIPISVAPHASLTRLQLGLSAIGTGLQKIKAGKIDEGLLCAQHGFDFLRKELGQ
jgi:hypothetical protein